MIFDSNNHSVFKLYYHLILVVKYRKKVITDDINEFAKERFIDIAYKYNITLEEIPIFSLVQNLNVGELVGEKYLDVLDQEIAKITNYYKFNMNAGDKSIEKLVLFNMSTKFTNDDIHKYFYEEGALIKTEVFDMKTISKIVDTLIDKECYIPLAASLVQPKGFW